MFPLPAIIPLLKAYNSSVSLLVWAATPEITDNVVEKSG